MATETGTSQGGVGTRQLTLDTSKAALSRLAVGSAVGIAAGAVVGGIGGRLAMFVLRLTSDSSLTGVQTDDDFEIGSFTSDTVFLVVLTAFGGAVLGVSYVAVRRWLPHAGRPATTAAIVGAIGGAAVIEPGGVDFTLLEPLWLAVVLFVALPAAFGAVLAWGVERAIPRVARRPALGLGLLVALVPVFLLGPVGAAVVLGGLGWAAVRRWPALGRVWWSPPVTMAGRILGVAGTTFALVVLAQDAVEIL